ncbi:MAG: ADP-ribosyl-[dinitrogen reductase] hydrolase [Candidatus Accumulibacter sp.]|uniref:ADP-ribosyl-[dinitrogen reductase] hydrolase n=1 Tax=Accumulibacter sp. TaxID=2053492 RepID=UPI0025EA4F68|nr:ADP-ribosyl-[dinitrogen reductase] hydrolase [Accumulibacter sp.]MCM8597506.1 ADP-ribosyl-[dinitrogen reductase] hydrolase [Accumulibacter sp.]MCM8661711.1 ADP-ribosyl-[dinitrogen reductase] hydrolase [Accumulibacter sp.]
MTPSPATVSSTITARAESAYLGLALGDALGATVEFMTPREIVHHFGVHRGIVGGGWLKLRPGQVTDDTSMSLALGDAILASGGRVDPLACAEAFDDWMRRKPVDIGNTVRRNLLTFRRTGVPAAPASEHDAGNGAAMRVLPVALATFGQSPAAVCAAVQAQAHVTHNNLVSDAVCQFLALAVQDLLRGCSLVETLGHHLGSLLAAHPALSFRDRPRRENPSGWVVETLQAVLQGLVDGGGFEDCLVDVVNRGGDADTTGAIAGMLAGALYGQQAIPKRWLQALDAGVADRCRAQARALLPLAA